METCIDRIYRLEPGAPCELGDTVEEPAALK